MEIMVDLEAYGSKPGSVILSIGACPFDKNGIAPVDKRFYVVISLDSSLSHGFTTSEQTMTWWSRQSEEAQQVLREAKDPLFNVGVRDALAMFSGWVRAQPGIPGVWGFGATFDNVLLREAYDLVGMTCPWHYRQDRCFRTLWALAPKDMEVVARVGTHHNALDDAVFQAEVGSRILRSIP